MITEDKGDSMTREEPATTASPTHSLETTPLQGGRQAPKRPRKREVPLTPPPWEIPDFSNQCRTRIGASIVQQFVAGHDACDVLRELVQNEFDGGGDTLTVMFGKDELNVLGNGRGINAAGWQRLSVIMGTGRVVGEVADERIEPKTNGIGSKNFGLRSLFLFGNIIYVRSNGRIALLNLSTLQTGSMEDPSGKGAKGVQLRVPYRQEKFEGLEPFTEVTEKHAFEVMADGMLATLVKLSLVGQKLGLRKLVLHSDRIGRTLTWKQSAEIVTQRMRGVSTLHRVGRLVDQQEDGERVTHRFEELEFSRTVAIPTEFADVTYPAYYRKTGRKIQIRVSLPIARNRIDFLATGNFYYPLQSGNSRTGCAVSVSAPFELNSDRSSLIDNTWNQWLVEQAATFAIELLKEIWFPKFGVDAYKALIRRHPESPSWFADTIKKHLSDEACWAARVAKAPNRYFKASELVLPDDPLLDGFLSGSRYLNDALQADEEVRALAVGFGVKCFTLSSLVRLRCASESDKGLKTKLKNNEANYHYRSYEAALTGCDLQANIAAAITALSRRLSNENRADLSSSASTLTAADELRPAKDLVLVDPNIWDVCPEPMANRLHPRLVEHHSIAKGCKKFDEQDWIVNACDRARDGRIDDAEREALYAKLLASNTKVSRRALTALRDSPVVKNRCGQWSAPSAMVVLKDSQLKLMSPVVSVPSDEILACPELLSLLRIRHRLNGDDILAYATSIANRPLTAPKFESLLNDNQNLFTPTLVEQLKNVAFLRARSGKLACPSNLHLDRHSNRLCLNDNDLIVHGKNEALYRRLRVHEYPTVETLLEILASSRERAEEPPRPDEFYPALSMALNRSKNSRTTLTHEPILWVASGYHSPTEVLVGTKIPHVFDGIIPTLRHSSTLVQAYLDLGARAQPRDEHWIQLFKHFAQALAIDGKLSQHDFSKLMNAYYLRGSSGLPEGLDENVPCLLDRERRLFTLSDLKSGLLVENDYPVLASTITAANIEIGLVDLTEKSSSFFIKLGIRPLTAISGTGRSVFGAPASRLPRFSSQLHQDGLLTTLHTSIFAHALYECALRQRHTVAGLHSVKFAELQRRLRGINRIDFFDSISREYRVCGQVVRVSVDTAVQKGAIGLTQPRTEFEYFHLIAQALAELVGADNAAQARVLATAFLPLVLCRTSEELVCYLDRIGIELRKESIELGDEFDLEDNVVDEIEEEVRRHILRGLKTGQSDSKETESSSPGRVGASAAFHPGTSQTATPPFTLPDLNEVSISVIPAGEQQVLPRDAQGGGRSGGSSNGWRPRSTADVERDREVGDRGEELVYREELKRVREMGYEPPEDWVIWTSRTDRGADHDIQSIGEDGRIRWIEVKSTTGIDGHFEWSKKEFEKALSAREHYELWRVYQAASTSPVAKRFRNPIALLRTSRLVFELSSLRACIEGLD